jgi:hypothetical protein
MIDRFVVALREVSAGGESVFRNRVLSMAMEVETGDNTSTNEVTNTDGVVVALREASIGVENWMSLFELRLYRLVLCEASAGVESCMSSLKLRSCRLVVGAGDCTAELVYLLKNGAVWVDVHFVPDGPKYVVSFL